jgi:hypothetical protein
MTFLMSVLCTSMARDVKEGRGLAHGELLSASILDVGI